MNIRSFFFASILSLGLGAVTLTAVADSAEGLGTWEGAGVASDASSGSDLGPFTITLVRRSTAPGKIRTDGTVKTGDGKTITFWQETEDKGPRAFRLVSNRGTGGGRCFANGMCQSLEQQPDGHAFATTIAKDGGGKLRVLVTELESGKAVRFYDQTLLKKP